MLFIVTLTHSPENCWMRGENRETGREWVATMDERATKHGVELHGAYVTPNEHTFHLVVEAPELAAVTAFLGPPLLTDHEGDVMPVISLERANIFAD